jgi:quercetin dioxygenase-like cupin family protein
MDTAAFEASLKSSGYEVGTSRGTPGKVTQPHSHDFDVRALVLSGELTLTTEGTSRTYRGGDIFEMPAGCVHSEQYGPDGSESLVGRRTKPAHI